MTANVIPTAWREGQGRFWARKSDAVVVAHGRIKGRPAVVAAFEFGFMGGSMGVAAGEAILAAAKLAVMQEAGADRPSSFGRRAHAGRRLVADAVAADDHRRRHGQGGGAALDRRADRSDEGAASRPPLRWSATSP